MVGVNYFASFSVLVVYKDLLFVSGIV